MHVAEYPYLSDPITSECEHSGAHVLNTSPRRCDSKDLAAMSASVSEPGEGLIALGDNLLNLIREIGEGTLDVIDIFAKLGKTTPKLSKRAAKP